MGDGTACYRLSLKAIFKLMQFYWRILPRYSFIMYPDLIMLFWDAFSSPQTGIASVHK